MNIMDDKIYQAAFADLSRLTEYTARSHRDKTADDDGWTHEQTWRFVDGERVTLNGESYDDLIFPASAGYDVLTFEVPNDGDPATFDVGEHVHRHPVIGWRLTLDDLDGITTAGRDEIGCSKTVFGWIKGFALPDGHVVWQGRFAPDKPDPRYGKICASFDEWIGLVREAWAELIEDVEEEEQRRAEAAMPCSHCGQRKGMLDDEIPF